ncbi:MAG TPA: NAD(P)-dependent oxidoreductase, partial [Desulfobacterales bacterium]|nr:NAD(P)-dependent oxidoreductase [Desulfobacterales bacterium]
GSHLADVLTETGFSVHIFDAIPSPWCNPEQEMVVGDIRDEQALRKCVTGARYVYHLAGIADIGQAASSPRATVEHNIIGSTIVLENCLHAGVERLLFASTVYVYSQQGSFYRVSKQATELLIEAYYERFGLEYTILRYGSLYGPRAQEWNGLKRYVSQAIKEGIIAYPGTGEERREYIHVKDAARLSVVALAPEHANQCLTLTGTQVLNSKELLHMIREILGGKVKLIFDPEGRDPAHYEVTPYRFTPRVARKIVPNVFVDIGQGILDLIEEVYQNQEKK